MCKSGKGEFSLNFTLTHKLGQWIVTTYPPESNINYPTYNDGDTGRHAIACGLHKRVHFYENKIIIEVLLLETAFALQVGASQESIKYSFIAKQRIM